MKFYLRRVIGDYARYAQDLPTYILVGRWTHLFNEITREWFVVSDAHVPHRDGCELLPITFKTWRLATGKLGLIHLLEDFIGYRPISRRIRNPESPSLEPPRVGSFGP